MPTNETPQAIRVRFAPSPTGYLHIGSARTVLFNWLLARKHGGTFVLRIEDTDQARNVEDSVGKIVEDLRWLGLAWDEGPEVEGAYGPYFQSRRLGLYEQYLQQLLQSGDAYYALESPRDLEEMRRKADVEKRPISYVRPHPIPTIEQGLAAKAAGRPVVVRFKMPGHDISVRDDILGTVTVPAAQLEDFVIQKGDGFPTYHFACVVDDELMRITHVLRGQEHLMNTPKHIALQQALGFGTPRYAHLSVIFNIDGTKMSKRDKDKAIKAGLPPPEIDVHDFRLAGYLPEAIINFIALLGWSPGDDREEFSLAALTEAFSIERVGKTNARFDRAKLLSFNTDWATRLRADRLLEAFRDFLSVPRSADAGGVSIPPAMREASDEMLARILHACAGFRTFADVVVKAKFLFVGDEQINHDPKAVAKVLEKNDAAGYSLLEFVLPKMELQGEWAAGPIEALLDGVCAERATSMGNVAQPIRVAITGSTISPGIGVSLEMLGKASTLSRIRQCLAMR